MATKKLEAIYEHGVLRPLEPLQLPEHQRVTIVLTSGEEDLLDEECLHVCAAEADTSITLEAVREALKKIPHSLTADFIAEREEP